MTIDSNAASHLRVTWHGRSVVGCVRKNNEDSLWAGDLVADAKDPAEHDETFDGSAVISRPGVLLAVADGMGGAKAGEVASGMAVQILREEMLGRANADGIADAPIDTLAETFIAAVETGNEKIRDDGAGNPSRQGMGTTLTAIWAYDDVAQMVHVGDSRAYMFRKGNLTRLTKDQSLVEKLLEDKIISPEEAQRMGVKNIILQALGSEEDLDVAHPRTNLEAGDIVILCTDGLTGVVADEDLEEGLRQGGGLNAVCSRFIQAAEDGGGPDNITVLLGHVTHAHQAPPA